MPTMVRKLELAGASSPRPLARGGTVRVAIASQDGKALNAHFGFAQRLMVYDVTPRGHRLVRVVRCASDGRNDGVDCMYDGRDEGADDDKIASKVAALEGCHILYVLAIGPPAAAKVIQSNIHPIKLGAPEAIESVIARVQTMMTVEPPWWLRKILLEN